MKWLSTIKHVETRHDHGREDGARRQGLPAAHRRARDARGRLAGARARPGRRSRRCSTDVPGLVIEDGVVQRRPQHDDRSSRHLRRRRHGALGAHRHRRGRPRQEGRAPHRRVAARRDSTPSPRQHEAATLRPAQHLVLLRRPEDGAARRSTRSAASRASTKVQGAWTRRTRSSRRAAASPAAIASSATTATASAPTMRSSSSAPASASSSTTTTARAAACAPRSARAARSTWCRKRSDLDQASAGAYVTAGIAR